MLALWIILGVIFGLLLICVIAVIGIYNSLIRLRNQAEEGFSTMDVYMKKRYDLLPNYIETVKGYAKHEQETLTKVIAARNNAMNATSVEDKVANEAALSNMLKQLAVVVEQYPQLKANENFMGLQNQLNELEADIANARKYYNATVKSFNNRVEVFPSNIIANIFKFTKKVFFELDSAEERKVPKVDFSK